MDSTGSRPAPPEDIHQKIATFESFTNNISGRLKVINDRFKVILPKTSCHKELSEFEQSIKQCNNLYHQKISLLERESSSLDYKHFEILVSHCEGEMQKNLATIEQSMESFTPTVNPAMIGLQPNGGYPEITKSRRTTSSAASSSFPTSSLAERSHSMTDRKVEELAVAVKEPSLAERSHSMTDSKEVAALVVAVKELQEKERERAAGKARRQEEKRIQREREREEKRIQREREREEDKQLLVASVIEALQKSIQPKHTNDSTESTAPIPIKNFTTTDKTGSHGSSPASTKSRPSSEDSSPDGRDQSPLHVAESSAGYDKLKSSRGKN